MPSPIHSPYQNKYVLITGGLGFIGSSLAHALVESGAHVTIVDCELEESGANLFNVQDIQDEITLARIDIAERKKLTPLIEKAEVIFNLAGYNNHRDSMLHPEKDLHANCTSQLAFLSECAALKTGAPIVFTGTRTQYGSVTANPLTEDAPQRPIDIHGAHKTLAEKYHTLFFKNQGLKTICTRLVNTFGPRQALVPRGIGLIAGFIVAALEDTEIEIFGHANRTREVVFIDDALDALLRLGLLPEAVGECFNIGGMLVSLQEMAETLTASTGKGRIVSKNFPEEIRRIEVGEVQLDSSKIERMCNWKPVTIPSVGLDATIQFFLQHQREYLPA